MIMRNTLILVDQPDHDLAAGAAPFEAVVESTVCRARPVVLTALGPFWRWPRWQGQSSGGRADRGDGSEAVFPASPLRNLFRDHAHAARRGRRTCCGV